jgi:cell volume regulation protein A
MAGLGLGIALLLAILIRPLVVGLCLAPFRYAAREIAFIGWVGLRGAVPIVLATYPVLVGAPGADRIFHLVFFIVVVGAIIPGGTVAWARRPPSSQPPAPRTLAIESRCRSGRLMSF